MNLQKTLLKDAGRKNACRSGLDKLKGMTDRREMVSLYLDNIDFCLSNEFPENGFIHANFGDIINDMGIFLDDAFEIENKPHCVLLGASHGQMSIGDFNVSEVFIKHDSTLTLHASGNAFVMVDIFDDTILNVHATDRAKVYVNRYGGEINVESKDESHVKIREKHKKSY